MRTVKGFAARLGTEHVGGTWMLIACAEFLLAFFLASTLFQFGSANDGWSWSASVAGGIVCPALGMLLIAGDPGRYRTFGYPVRAWLVDHAVLGVLVLLLLLSGPVFELVNGRTYGASGWTVVVPVLTVGAVTAGVLFHHRDLLTGRTQRGRTRDAWYDRVFLARSGPLLWRVVYQPVGTVALVAAVVVVPWAAAPDVYSLPAASLLVSLICAAVVTVSQRTATAVGMPRRVWLAHTVAAVAVPVALVNAVGTVGLSGRPVEVKETGTGSMIAASGVVLVLATLVAVVAGVMAGALAVACSYESIGAGILWMIFINLLLTLFPQFQWEGMSQSTSGLLHLGWTVIITVGALSYARHRVVTGQPDWTGTRIIRTTRRKALA